MALRDQPYLPLYIQDVLTDEKLSECSAESHGVYFLLLCLLHKQEQYGTILLKQKYKQSSSTCLNFASMLARKMPFDVQIISRAIDELINENVIQVDGDRLIQKRMVKDNQTSIARSAAGKKGGTSTQKKYSKFAKAKSEANTEYEDDNEDVNKEEGEKRKTRATKSEIIYPFSSDVFLDGWEIWKDYKKIEHRFNYKSQISEQAALNKLDTLSGHNETTALAIIKNAIANGWKGFFPLGGKIELPKSNGKSSLDLYMEAKEMFSKKQKQ